MIVTFQTLAELDYQAAGALLESKATVHNISSLHSRQAVEKYLKFLLARSSSHEDMKIGMPEIQSLIASHNLTKIMYTCMDVYTDLYKLKKEIIELTDLYFKINYPGSEFYFVNKEASLIHYATATKVKECCLAILSGKRY